MSEDDVNLKLDTGLLISADSHVMEAGDLWVRQLPASMRSKAPQYPEGKEANRFAAHDGARDPKNRIHEMATDGVSSEVLYPTRALDQFGISDIALQEACFKVYNDWLLEYCSVAPDRLFGVACISAYRIDEAIREVERCKKAGMRGLMIWLAAPPELAFSGSHYDPLWEAAQAMEMPVSLHILTGAPYGLGVALTPRIPTDLFNFAMTEQIGHTMKTLVHMIASGVFDRFPKLKVIIVETEVSWMPFMMCQMDKYNLKKYRDNPIIKMHPSEYFKRNIFATFFNDPPSGQLFEKWGGDNWMWSNDFPHPNSTWPHSREVIARDMGHLAPELRAKLVRENVTRIYNLPEIQPLANLA